MYPHEPIENIYNEIRSYEIGNLPNISHLNASGWFLILKHNEQYCHCSGISPPPTCKMYDPDIPFEATFDYIILKSLETTAAILKRKVEYGISTLFSVLANIVTTTEPKKSLSQQQAYLKYGQTFNESIQTLMNDIDTNENNYINDISVLVHNN